MNLIRMLVRKKNLQILKVFNKHLNYLLSTNRFIAFSTKTDIISPFLLNNSLNLFLQSFEIKKLTLSFFLFCLIFPSVNSDENSEDDYIEYTLLLHCKLKTKKNARVIDFSGVFEFLYGYSGDYILIHLFNKSSISYLF